MDYEEIMSKMEKFQFYYKFDITFQIYWFMGKNIKIRQRTFKSLIRFVCFSLIEDNSFVLFFTLI